MKKFSFIAGILILSMAAVAFAGNYRLPVDGTGKYAVQGHAPTEQVTRTLGTGGVSVFKNISTANLASVRCTGRTAAGVATVVKMRVGGFSTGLETDVYPTSEETVVNPPAKVGFRAYSTATVISVHCTK